MARIPAPMRESVPQDQLDAFDEYVESRGSIPTTGPMSVMLNVPEVLKRGEHLRAYLRGDGSSLPRPIIELAMLVTARENNCQFIWNAHAAAGRAAGLHDDLVNNLRDKKDLPALSPQEQAVWNTAGSSSAPARSARPPSTTLWPSSAPADWPS